jgi:hypothetical protein
MKKQTTLIVILFLLLSNITQAQIGDVAWATCTGGEVSFEKPRDTATDSDGNIYITGYFDKTINFGNIVLNSPFTTGIFLAKYSSSGNIIWAKSFQSGGSLNKGFGLTTDNTGNVYLSGSFNGANLILGSVTLTQNSGYTSQFVVKLDSNGNAIWGRAIASPSGTIAQRDNDIAVDSNGAVIMAGNYYGGCIINGTQITSIGVGAYIIKYDAEGTLQWYRYPTGATTIRAIALDGSNNIYFTGDNSGKMSLGPNNFPTLGIFTGKYNTSGDLAWLKQGVRDYSVLGSGSVYSFDINADDSGNSVITGTYSGSISFSGNTLTETPIVLTPPVNNSFVVKYDNSGNVLWAKKAIATPVPTMNTHVRGTKVQFDNNGNVYICGITNTEINFDNIILTHDNDLPVPIMFIARYNAQGNVNWAKKVCISSLFIDENYLGLIVENDNLVISGICYDNTTIGDIPFTEGGIFIAKIGIPVMSNSDFTKNNSITIFPNPVKDEITINSTNEFNAVNIFNTLGQLVKVSVNINEISHIVNVSDLETGYYFIEVTSGKNKTQQKFIKL